MLSDCKTMTMTSCRLNGTLSTGIFDMRPTEDSLAIKAKKTGSGEHQRKSRNGCKILTADTSRVCNARREYSLSTGSEFLRPRHIVFCSATSCQSTFFDDPPKVTPRVTGATFSPVHLCHVLLCRFCVCVHFRRALESQAKRCFHISHHIGLHRFAHTAHSTHNCEAAHGEKQDVARQRFKEGFRPALSQQSGSCTQGGSVAPEVALGLMRQTTGAKVMPVVEGTMLSGGSHGTWKNARAERFSCSCPA